jgi:hypothetical protein
MGTGETYFIRTSAGILEQSMRARNRVGIGFVVPGRQATKAGGISSLEKIPRLLKRLQIRALFKTTFYLQARMECRLCFLAMLTSKNKRVILSYTP